MENQSKVITLGAMGKYDNLRPQVKPVSATYAEMVEMKQQGKLIPGQYYRITDYVTTTAQADTQSAGHQFDVLVRADDASTLNEQAYAMLHSGDTYFQNARLEAWELKYCLENDTERFAWADTVNGKGVIYGMKDEWGNECPYDFKNIMFKRCYCEPEQFDDEGKYFAIPGLTVGKDNEQLPEQDDENFVYMYTFSCLASLDEDPSDQPAQADASMGFYQSEDEMSADYGDSPRPLNNVLDAYFVCQSIDDEPLTRVMALPNITFGQFYTASSSYNVRNNHFGGDCHDLSLKAKQFYGNTLTAAHDSYFFGNVSNSSFGDVWNSSFGYVSNSQFFGDVWNSSFGYVENSSFGYVSNSQFFGNVSNSQFFGYVENSSFGDVYYTQFFGNVGSSSFGYVRYSSFGNVESSSFGNLQKCKGSAYINNADFAPATTGGTIENIEVVGALDFASKTTITVPAGGTAVQYIGRNSSGAVKIWKPADLV